MTLTFYMRPKEPPSTNLSKRALTSIGQLNFAAHQRCEVAQHCYWENGLDYILKQNMAEGTAAW